MPYLWNLTFALIDGKRRIASWGLLRLVIWGGVVGRCHAAKRIYHPGSSPAFCSCRFPSICIQQNALFLWNTPCPKLWPSFTTLLIHSGSRLRIPAVLEGSLNQILMFGASCGLVIQLSLALCNLWTVAHQAPQSMGFSVCIVLPF